jgi:hypothetical protein
MMEVFNSLKSNNFTKVDYAVLRDPRINLMAFKLYVHYCSFKSGSDFSDEYLAVLLGNVSTKSVTRARATLVTIGLLLVEKISPRRWVVYVRDTGSTFEEIKNKRNKTNSLE